MVTKNSTVALVASLVAAAVRLSVWFAYPLAARLRGASSETPALKRGARHA
jgi:hypothetical protein